MGHRQSEHNEADHWPVGYSEANTRSYIYQRDVEDNAIEPVITPVGFLVMFEKPVIRHYVLRDTMMRDRGIARKVADDL